MEHGILYYKDKSGSNIPIDIQGISSPIIPRSLYDKLINDFHPVLPMFIQLNGKSFKVQSFDEDGDHNKLI